MLLLMLSLALAGGAMGEPFAILGVGLTSVVLAAAYLVTLRISMDEKYLPRWHSADEAHPVKNSEKRDIFLIGLLERRNRTMLGMGVDSLAVLVVYLAGLGGLYYVRNEPGF